MGLYDRYILPKITHLVCGAAPIRRQREKLVPLARGRVLEVGIGSGLNLPFYDAAKVSRVWGLDPAPGMLRMAQRAAGRRPFAVDLLPVQGEEIPLETASVDAVVLTYTLCTIADPVAALQQMRRVLRPGGVLLFSEHGAAPDPGVRHWQDRLDPLWTRLAGGCHLNRDIPALLQAGGFRVASLETHYLTGWRFASFNYRGAAV